MRVDLNLDTGLSSGSCNMQPRRIMLLLFGVSSLGKFDGKPTGATDSAAGASCRFALSSREDEKKEHA